MAAERPLPYAGMEVALALTVHSGQLAMAMLRGHRRTLAHTRALSPGWYYIHVGVARPLSAGEQQALSLTWAAAPAAELVPSSAIVGRVCVLHAIRGSNLPSLEPVDPWCVLEPNAWHHWITDSIEYQQAVVPVRGLSSGAWRVKDATRAILATSHGVRSTFPSPVEWPASQPGPTAGGRLRVARPWQRRAVPRRPRPHATTMPDEPPTNLTMRLPDATRLAKRKRKQPEAGAAPAQYPALQLVPRSALGSRECSHLTLAQRLSVGRSGERLAALMRMHLLHKPVPLDCCSQDRACAGLFARLGDAFVFIVSTFERRGVPLADVAPLQATSRGDPDVRVANLREVRTCRQGELADVGLHFLLLPRRLYRGSPPSRLCFQRRRSAEQQCGIRGRGNSEPRALPA